MASKSDSAPDRAAVVTDMRAVVIDTFGDPGVLQVRRVPQPAPGPGELLVRVHAAAVNAVDAQSRADGSWARVRLPAILGADASGVVAGVGEGVDRFAPGDEVFYLADFLDVQHGTYAEYHVVDAAIVARKPAALDHVHAAALPLAASTALAVVHDRLDVRAGQSILIHGAAGGVGLYAVQLAKLRGALVVATASARRRGLLEELGVDAFIDYEPGDVPRRCAEAAGGTFDRVADLVGGGFLNAALPFVRHGGQVASIVELSGDLDEAIDRNLVVHGVLVRPGRQALERLAALVDAGRLRVVVDTVHPLEAVADAHRRVETGHGQGKVVLAIVPSG